MTEDADHVRKIVDLLKAEREREAEARAEFTCEIVELPLTAAEAAETGRCIRCGVVNDDAEYFGCWLCRATS